jgi:DNA-binding MarR family transcriptional regulator
MTSVLAPPRLFPLLDHFARVGRRAYEGAMVPGGLRSRHLVALKLLSERGAQGQQGLTDALSLDPSNVVALLNELEDRGLLVRRRDPSDRRRHIVELSSVGEEELAAAYARLARVEDELLGRLSSDERATLCELLQRAAGAGAPPCETDDDPSQGPARDQE